MRYGGIYAVAMAYAGTGNNKAIRRLLHVAVSDVNDDVRRAAVTSLGFLLFRTPSQVPRIVQLLSESYNPNVRYGAAIALGIACAGTGLEEAIELLEPMTKDTVDYVKQGSCIALAMILIQQNETLNPKTATVRKLFEKIVGDKHEDAMSKFGAALAQGIIDAGGRNATVSMRSKNGSSNLSAIVGMALFNQFWYWFPMTHFLSLAFTPTAVIGVNSDLKIPAFDLISNTRPSLFAYQPATAPPTEEKVEKVATAVLSTTAKANARAKTKKDKAAAESGDMDTVSRRPDAFVVARQALTFCTGRKDVWCRSFGRRRDEDGRGRSDGDRRQGCGRDRGLAVHRGQGQEEGRARLRQDPEPVSSHADPASLHHLPGRCALRARPTARRRGRRAGPDRVGQSVDLCRRPIDPPTRRVRRYRRGRRDLDRQGQGAGQAGRVLGAELGQGLERMGACDGGSDGGWRGWSVGRRVGGRADC